MHACTQAQLRMCVVSALLDVRSDFIGSEVGEASVIDLPAMALVSLGMRLPRGPGCGRRRHHKRR